VQETLCNERFLADHRFRAMIVESSNHAHSLADSVACRKEPYLEPHRPSWCTPLDGAILWLRIQVDLPCVISREVPLEMRLRESERSGRQGLHSVDLVRPDTRQVLGRMENETHVLSCERYDVIR
jgi:hypothetical protein